MWDVASFEMKFPSAGCFAPEQTLRHHSSNNTNAKKCRQLISYGPPRQIDNKTGNQFGKPFGSHFGKHFGKRFGRHFGKQFGKHFGKHLGKPKTI